MSVIKNWQIRILVGLAVVCMMDLYGCGYTIARKEKIVALPEGAISESHPTVPGYECFPTGYIQEVLTEIDLCLDK